VHCWGAHIFFGVLILVPIPHLLKKKKKKEIEEVNGVLDTFINILSGEFQEKP
jgi:flagellar motor component MotA